MKSTFLLAAASVIPAVFGAGFNIGHTTRDGKCKTKEQWVKDFTAVKSWTTGKTKFDTFKLFSTNDCNALMYAVPAAKEANVKLWVGVWNFPEAKFTAEKKALEDIMVANPDTSKWLAGINVGSESMYRNETKAPRLTEQIYDVRGMVMQKKLNPSGYRIPIGTADTWTKWIEGDTATVIKASDVVMMNGFPYWQGGAIKDGLSLLQLAISNTTNAINIATPNGQPKPTFVLGETGWPSAGKNFGNAVPSPENQQAYWKQAACWLQNTSYQWFWFSAFNEPHRDSEVERNFGVARAADQSLKINLAC